MVILIPARCDAHGHVQGSWGWVGGSNRSNNGYADATWCYNEKLRITSAGFLQVHVRSAAAVAFRAVRERSSLFEDAASGLSLSIVLLLDWLSHASVCVGGVNWWNHAGAMEARGALSARVMLDGEYFIAGCGFTKPHRLAILPFTCWSAGERVSAPSWLPRAGGGVGVGV